MKYPVGTVIVPNAKANKYGITREPDMTEGIVVPSNEMTRDDRIRIKITKGSYSGVNNFNVDPDCFDLASKDDFEAYLRGHISEKEYTKRRERG